MKRVLFLILVLGALICIQVVNTYGLFETDALMDAEVNSAKWVIKLNDVNIMESNEFSIDSLNLISNDNVKSGKFAPGVKGYFDVVVDPSLTEVSVVYSVTVDLSNIGNESIVLSSVSETSGRELIRTGENTYSGIISLDDINNGVTLDIRFSFEWLDDREEVIEDLSEFNSRSMSIPVVFDFKQYLGEVITAYSE